MAEQKPRWFENLSPDRVAHWELQRRIADRAHDLAREGLSVAEAQRRARAEEGRT